MSKISYKKKCQELESIIQDIWWMARRYAHGRQTYAVSDFNNAIRRAQDLGMEFPRDFDGLIEAKDGMLDKDWFDAQNINSLNFIKKDDDKN